MKIALVQLYKIFQHWGSEGATWIYSDPHFGDTELELCIPTRPTASEQVKMINSKVGRKDTLIILGDIGDIEYAKQLRGYKILIAGNHDAGLSHYKEVFNEVYGGPLIISDKIILSHEPIDVPWAFNIHGHVHDPKAKDKKNQLNVCADIIEYTPINFNQLLKKGVAAGVETIHRTTINNATEKKSIKNGKKKIYSVHGRRNIK